MEGVVAKRTLKKSYYKNRGITNERGSGSARSGLSKNQVGLKEKILYKMSLQMLTMLAIVTFVVLMKYLNLKVVLESSIVNKIKAEYKNNYTMTDILGNAKVIYDKAYVMVKPIIPETFITKVKEIKQNFKNRNVINNENNKDNKENEGVVIYEESDNNKENTEGQSVGVSVDETKEDIVVAVSSSLSSEGSVAEKIISEGVTFVKPLTGVITSRFGAREVIFEGIDSYHTGIDIANSLGKAIVSSIDGTVTVATYNKYNGNYVEVQNGKIVTKYCHMSKISVKSGTKIKAGEKIGEVGSTGLSTGPHLHFEIVYNGTKINPELIVKF